MGGAFSCKKKSVWKKNHEISDSRLKNQFVNNIMRFMRGCKQSAVRF